jgi:aryl-alcohol dehydrogenase-like predicted oxidoreductase
VTGGGRAPSYRRRMGTRRIGGAGFEVGSVGLCCIPLSSDHLAHPEQDRSALPLIAQALDAGVTLLSTSDAAIANELVVGRALAEVGRDRAVVSTRVGLVAQADGTGVRRGTPEHVRTAIDHSLRRLRTDRVDLYVLDGPDPSVPLEDTWGAMAEVVSAGKARALGLATDRAALAARAQSVFPVTAVCAPVSLARPRPDLVRWCTDRGVGLLAESPLAGGHLADGRGGGVHAYVAHVAERHGRSAAEVALAALLDLGPTVVPLVGTTRADRVRAAAGAADLVLSDEDRATLATPDDASVGAER